LFDPKQVIFVGVIVTVGAFAEVTFTVAVAEQPPAVTVTV
jgi:hypothetical protein